MESLIHHTSRRQPPKTSDYTESFRIIPRIQRLYAMRLLLAYSEIAQTGYTPKARDALPDRGSAVAPRAAHRNPLLPRFWFD